MDDQAITPSKPHYGVATLSVGIEHRFEGHEAYEGQGFSSLLVLETARGHLVARMYDPADGRFISRDPIGFKGSPWNLYEYVGGNALNRTDPDGRRYLDVPATPSKCAQAEGLITLYATLHQWTTYDKYLWDRYRSHTGVERNLPIGAFDPESEDRNHLKKKLLNKIGIGPGSFAPMQCNHKHWRGRFSDRKAFYNGVTRMISRYQMSATLDYWFRKRCFLGCWQTCYIDYVIKYKAWDRTDFNPGEGFTGPVGEVTITDDLILACHSGTAFDINGNTTERGSVKVDCKNPMIE